MIHLYTLYFRFRPRYINVVLFLWLKLSSLRQSLLNLEKWTNLITYSRSELDSCNSFLLCKIIVFQKASIVIKKACVWRFLDYKCFVLSKKNVFGLQLTHSEIQWRILNYNWCFLKIMWSFPKYNWKRQSYSWSEVHAYMINHDKTKTRKMLKNDWIWLLRWHQWKESRYDTTFRVTTLWRHFISFCVIKPTSTQS